MQLGATRSYTPTFKGYNDYQEPVHFSEADYEDLTGQDSFEMQNMVDMTRAFDKAMQAKQPQKEGERKNPIFSIASILAGFATLCFVGRQGSQKIVNSLAQDETIAKYGQKAINFATDTLQKGAIKLSDNSNKVAKFIGEKAIAIMDSMNPKKIYSLIGIVTGIAGTKELIKADGNDNNIPDICEKGANAYMTILEDTGLVKQGLRIFNALA